MHRLVETQSELEALARTLAQAPVLYLDTEFESTKREKTLCLLQISGGEEIFLIDTLRLKNLSPLRPLLANSETEWVLHAGQQDVELLSEALGLKQAPLLFDTQVAWALQGPEYSVSLAYLQYKLLGLKVPKGHQADDWKRRPLPDSQLAYAAADIEHLPAMRSLLRARAEEKQRIDIVHAASREAVWPDPTPPARISLASFRNAWQLDPHSQAGLRFIIEWYNGMSPSERASAPEQKTLLSIAMRMPSSGDELARIKGVPRRWAKHHGDRLAGQLMRASAQAETGDFVPIEPPPYATFAEIRLDAWLATLRAELCESLEVAPELALPMRILKTQRAEILATGDPASATAGLVGWRKQLLEAPFLEACQRLGPPRLDQAGP